jgi:WhiB family redox-sensing transcriptional regulator
MVVELVASSERARYERARRRAVAQLHGDPTDLYLVDAEPTRARLERLLVNGWGVTQIAAELGVTYRTMRLVRTGDHRRVRESTAAAIRRLPLTAPGATTSRPVAPVPPPASWWERAGCAGVDVAVFFPEEHQPHPYDQARAICAGCPVVDECRNHFDQAEPSQLHGFLGGESPNERSARRRRARRRRS